MNKRWYYADKGKSVGPFSLGELNSILQGVPSWRDTLVWREGDDQWQKAGSIRDLAEFRAAPPPIPNDQIQENAAIPRDGHNAISRKTTLWLIALYFLVALIFSSYVEMSKPFAKIDYVSVAKGLGAAFALFLISGILPMIVWGFRRFRSEVALTPMALWCTLLFVLAVLSWRGTQVQREIEIQRPSKTGFTGPQGITFRSTEFQFRFVYPPNWIEKTPRGQNVRALIDAPDGASNCNIVVRRVPELARLSQKEIDAEALAAPMSDADWKELLGSKFSNLRIRERRLTKVDNQPAHFVVNEMSYTTVAASVYAVQMQFVTMTPGLFWNFGCLSGEQTPEIANSTFQKMRPTFTAILSSFVFEQ
jgi:GYF domain 2